MEHTIKFQEEDFENFNIMVSSKDMFPDCEPFFISNENGIKYELIEGYCKNHECNCTEITAYLVPENKENLISFRYDYVNQDSKNVPDFAKSLFQEATFNELLLRRNRVIRLVFGNEVLLRENAALRLNIKKNSIKQLNRNDTCFCGSGKKYKKCCLNL